MSKVTDSVVQSANKRARLDRISFCVRSPQGQIITFTSKRETLFGQIYRAVAQKWNVDEFSFRLVYDGKSIDPMKAVSEVLGNDEDIMIDMLREQVGC